MMIINLSLKGLQIFLVAVLCVISLHFGLLFLDRHGWSHRLAGAFHFMLLVVGAWTIPRQSDPTGINSALLYDVVLGCSGVTVTLTAARDFPHRYVQNAVGESGTLSSRAMVTQAEMLEHAFYQFLNLWQALYLHGMVLIARAKQHQQQQQPEDTMWWLLARQWLALLLVTAPWWVRKRFPVNSFSHNWIKKQKRSTDKTTTLQQNANDVETLLYRIKKAQYIFYKHVVLHGLNLSLCVAPSPDLVVKPSWRLFWICLNTSYVMEFFLQSLVKRHVLQQATMLFWNRWLMLVSSLSALASVLLVVRWELCMASLVLNFVHRHHDVFNTMLLGTLALVLTTLTGTG